MAPGATEKGLSDNLLEAIDIEEIISDLLKDDPKRELYFKDIGCLEREADEVATRLSSDEQKFITGLGKAFWYLRVTLSDQPKTHPEYCPSMLRQVHDAVGALEDISDPNLRQRALIRIEGLHLLEFYRPQI